MRDSLKLGRLMIMSMLVATLAVRSGFPALPPGQDSQGTQWKMVYEAGVAPIQNNNVITVKISQQNLVLQPKKGAAFSIAAAGITAVSSNLVSAHTASRDQAGAWVEMVRFSPYMLMGLPFGLAGMAATYPIKSHYAYVSVLWSDNGTEQEVLLKLSHADYTPFLAELQRATGKEWRNLDTEWAKVREQLKNGGAAKISIHLANTVRILKTDLKPGDFQLVLLERDANHGDLYFFPGNQVNVEHLAAAAPVEIQPAENDPQTDPITYKQDTTGITAISSIRMDSKTLRFP